MGALADKYRAPATTGTSLADKYRAKPVEAAAPEPEAFSPESASGAALRGFGQGASLGFSDELRGLTGAADELGARMAAPFWKERGLQQTRPEQGLLDALSGRYAEDRGEARHEEKRAEEAHPALYNGTELAGGLMVPIPGASPIKGAGVGAKVLRGALTAAEMGGAIGAGKSEADTIGGVAADAAESAGLSAPLGAAGSLAGYGAGKLATRFGGRAAEVKAAKAATDLEKMTASRAGEYGQKVQDANRALINMESVLANPNADPALKAKIRVFKASPEGKALVDQVGANTLEEAPKKFAQMADLKASLASAPEDAAKETEAYFAKSTLKEDVLPRAKKYAARLLPQGVADAVGDLAGGAKGVAAGVAGALSGAALGAPGTSLANLMQKTPRFNAQLLSALESGSSQIEKALGNAGPQFAAQATREGREKVLEKALAEDPEAEARITAALGAPRTLAQRFGTSGAAAGANKPKNQRMAK